MKKLNSSVLRPVPLSIALLLGTLGGAQWVAAQAQAAVEVGPVIKFQPGTAKAKAFFLKHAATRELVAEDFEMAGVDLDGDGRPEIVLRSTAASFCSGRAGCAVQVLQQRGPKVVELLSMFTSNRLAVTRQPVGGAYRALAIVDDQGQVVRADKPGTPMHGKPMVYPMRPGR
ncbi:MAG TPA: hypothetical protein PKC59_09560 [Burkholderiaceae bacterium]|nr:hypothetical protein [Burkholderiaceae bacterium]HMZ00958.1 hypothetical protein [Burkholderiaceae bacterium]HNB44477.1 hypothetical protein [Burkholderiaceae bacterium]HNG80225.1 hypothetical protein [Burkholderiaceae bacterium]